MAWGFSTSLLFLLALVLQNWQRSRAKVVRDLVPNCLLTSHPLLFIPGQRSLFYFLGYWNEIPHWLASHGYEVFHLSLPWKNGPRREAVFHQFLMKHSESGKRFHLFLDQSSLNEVKKLLQNHDFECLASVTLVGSSQGRKTALPSRLNLPIEELSLPERPGRQPLFWFLHRLLIAPSTSLSQLGWKLNRDQGQCLLQRTQFLAERDLLQRSRSPNLKA